MNLIGLRRFILGSFDLLVLVGVVVPLLLGIRLKLHALPELIADGPLAFGSALSWGFIAVVPILFTLYLAGRKTEPKGYYIFILAIIAVLLRLVFVLGINDEFFSDYLTMWNFALSVTQGEKELLATTIPGNTYASLSVTRCNAIGWQGVLDLKLPIYSLQ